MSDKNECAAMVDGKHCWHRRDIQVSTGNPEWDTLGVICCHCGAYGRAIPEVIKDEMHGRYNPVTTIAYRYETIKD